MTTFYFIRHGERDFSEENTKFYWGRGCDLLTLSELGIKQIKSAAHDKRLKAAELIITSPFGRALHSAAILSKELGLELRVETDLHEWASDAAEFSYLPQKEADRRFQELLDHNGRHPAREAPGWESADQMKQRVFAVLDKYKNYRCVIVCCHGVLMQYVLDIPHPANGQIEKLVY